MDKELVSKIQNSGQAFQIRIRDRIIDLGKKKMNFSGYIRQIVFPCYFYYFDGNELVVENYLSVIHEQLIGMRKYNVLFPNGKVLKLSRREISHIYGPVRTYNDETISIAKIHNFTGTGIGNLKREFNTDEEHVLISEAQMKVNALFNVPFRERHRYTAVIRDICRKRQLNGGLYYKWYEEDGPYELCKDIIDVHEFITNSTKSRE
ncbi:hypothetical protein ACN6KS_22650 [Paenibacillus nitricinens]|uniref:hypothetical protein n=1 Tax=Paenibacillus nitricinens TaxID=3367691 RepID=UPI003F82D6C7